MQMYDLRDNCVCISLGVSSKPQAFGRQNGTSEAVTSHMGRGRDTILLQGRGTAQCDHVYPLDCGHPD